MKLRSICRTALWASCACMGMTALSCGRSEQRSSAPIVLITIDTLRADHLSTYGYFRETSPTLDRLAEEAMVFDRVFTTMATTLPAHASLMTSTWTTTHGLKGNFSHLKGALDDETGLRTLAEMLAGLGYQTAAFVSAAPVRAHTGLHRGFAIYDQPEEKERRAEATTDRAISWLESQSKGPFFLWLHYFDPHRPRQPPAPYDEAFVTDDDLIGFLQQRGVKNARNRHLQRQINRYDGEILYTDRQIGRVFDALRSRGGWQDTAVVVTADHGEGLGQHNWMDHGQIYNEQLLVPLIIKFPAGRGPGGIRLSTTSSLVDVIPTLVAALDLPIADADLSQFEGVELLGADETRTGVLSEQSHRVNEPGLKYTWTNREWKYFHRTEAPDELYSLVEDPHEQRNVIDEHPVVAQEMLEEVQKALAGPAVRERETKAELDEEVAQQLRALGYLGGPSADDTPGLWLGMAVWGHEVREFRPCGSDEALWVVDETESLWERYRELTRDADPYSEVYVEVSGSIEPPPRDGFGSAYSEMIRVVEVSSVTGNGSGCSALSDGS